MTQTSDDKNHKAMNVFLLAATLPFFAMAIVFLNMTIDHAKDRKDRQTPYTLNDDRCTGKTIKLRHYHNCQRMANRRKELSND